MNAKPKEIKSRYHAANGRSWQLWFLGQGERAIYVVDNDGRRPVAYMRCETRPAYSCNDPRAYDKSNRRILVRRWEVFQDKWTNHLGTYKSPEAALKQFCSNL